jgi:hypothetical protein
LSKVSLSDSRRLQECRRRFAFQAGAMAAFTMAGVSDDGR